MRSYMIILSSDAPYVDYTEVFEQGPDKLRYSIDGSLTFVKWSGDTPTSVQNLPNKQGPYTHSEIIEILDTNTWSQVIPDIED